MKKQRISNNAQVLLMLLCLVAFVEISSLISKFKQFTKLKVELQH